MKPTASQIKKAITAQLYDGGGDPTKRPFVFYSCIDPATDRLKRIKVYEGFAKCTTPEEIRENGNRLIKKINRKLKAGYNPFQKGKFIYSAEEGNSIAIPIEKVIDKPVLCISQQLQEALNGHAPNIARSTLQGYQSQLRIFVKWLRKIKLENTDVTTFTHVHANSFLNYLKTIGKHNTTRNQYRINLKQLFGLLIKDKQLANNPFIETRKLPSHKRSKKPFNLGQQKRLKEYIIASSFELWLFVQFEYYAFIRPKELRFLRISDIDLEEAKICVRGEISKNKKTQYVRIDEPLRKMLLEMNIESLPPSFYIFGKGGTPGNTPCSKNHFNKKHREVLKQLGFTDEYSLYSWKHTGAVMAVKAGVNLEYLRLQMRHHSLDQLKEYLKDLGVMDEEFMKFKMPEL